MAGLLAAPGDPLDQVGGADAVPLLFAVADEVDLGDDRLFVPDNAGVQLFATG